jgi:hypothetical protein
MQKRKLTLDELQVDSFVTSLSEKEEHTVNGGAEVFAEGSLVSIIQSLLYTCPPDDKTTCNAQATPCPGTWTSNCPKSSSSSSSHPVDQLHGDLIALDSMKIS